MQELIISKKKMQTARMTKEERAESERATKECRFVSNLGAFKSTNGIRPGEFSVILGQQGNGKSTLCKTIAMECAINKHKCYVLLSEERSLVYKTTITKAFEEMAPSQEIAETFLDRLIFDSMIDWSESEKSVAFLLNHIESVINELMPEMIIFDNFTTSFLNDLPINKQGEIIAAFRKIASEYDIAMIGVFHTAKGTDIYKKLLDGEDVRGNATSTNGGAYIYILTTYFRTEPPRAFLTIDKARYHPLANKTYWEMNYEKTTNSFTSDKKSSYKELAEILAGVNRAKKGTTKW